MSTSDRTTAVVLSALLAAQPDHPLIDRLARYLVLGRKDAAGHPSAPVRNTQEAAFGLLGLWDFARIRENRVPDLTATVSLGRSTLLSRRLVGRNLSTLSHHVPMADLLRAVGQSRARLGFQRKGTGRLYYSARLTYARQDPREPATSRGFVVDRQVRLLDTTYRPFEAGRLLRLGNVVQVLVTVKNTEGRRYVVVDDPVPAGLEAIDRHLVNKRPGEPGAGETRFSTSAGKVVGSRYDHRELRDDRVLHFVDALEPGTHHFGYLARVTTPGTFVWPAARAVEMYSPEVYGGSVGGTMTTR